jgi:hypothetical protein
LSLSYKHYKRPVGKRKDPPKLSSQEAIKICKKKKEDSLIPLVYLLKRYVIQEARKNQTTKNHQKNWV